VSPCDFATQVVAVLVEAAVHLEVRLLRDAAREVLVATRTPARCAPIATRRSETSRSSTARRTSGLSMSEASNWPLNCCR
jgi:hypothetical protein